VLSAPFRRRPHRVGDGPCVPYAAASRADRSCTFCRQDHRLNQRRQLPVPLQFLLAPSLVPYATGIYPEDRYPEEKTHNHAKYIYAPYLVVSRLAKIVKCHRPPALASSLTASSISQSLADTRPTLARRLRLAQDASDRQLQARSRRLKEQNAWPHDSILLLERHESGTEENGNCRASVSDAKYLKWE